MSLHIVFLAVTLLSVLHSFTIVTGLNLDPGHCDYVLGITMRHVHTRPDARHPTTKFMQDMLHRAPAAGEQLMCTIKRAPEQVLFLFINPDAVISIVEGAPPRSPPPFSLSL